MRVLAGLALFPIGLLLVGIWITALITACHLDSISPRRRAHKEERRMPKVQISGTSHGKAKDDQKKDTNTKQEK